MYYLGSWGAGLDWSYLQQCFRGSEIEIRIRGREGRRGREGGGWGGREGRRGREGRGGEGKRTKCVV